MLCLHILHILHILQSCLAYINTLMIQDTQGIDDALIQPYSGHESRTSLEIYSKISLRAAQDSYDGVIDRFPV